MAENILDVIAELQTRGENDAEIIKQLRGMGFTSQEISDAVNQAKIKGAISGKETAETATQKPSSGMQPSIMQPEAAEEIPVPTPSKKRKAKEARISRAEEYAPTEAAYPYSYPTVQPSVAPTAAPSGADIETIEEIAEEIVSEKFSEIRQKVEDILDFREIMQSKINNLNDRLKRIELSIDGLQAALLGKVQEYSRDIKNLGSEMQALEGAFSKILNPLVDNVKELGRISENIKKEKKVK